METICLKSDWPFKAKAKAKAAVRVINYLVTEEGTIYLLTIYDKSEFQNVDGKILGPIIRTLMPNM